MRIPTKRIPCVLLTVIPSFFFTNCMRTSFGDVTISINGGYRSWNDGTYACSCKAYRNPSDSGGYHYLYEGSTGSGLYRIMPEGALLPLDVYCDMDTSGGGWTLVLLNSQYPTSPMPTWNEAINNNNISGSFANGLDSGLDLLLGLKYWNKLGATLRVETGSNPTTIVHRAYYTFNLSDSGANPLYNINLSNENIVSADKTQPGLYTTHNNKPFTTRDRDNDTNASNCSSIYSNFAWWYVSCWSGSFWGGSGYQLKPYWTGSSGDYHDWGAFWIR